MKMLNEANLDDKFTKALDRLQQSIIALEKLQKEFDASSTKLLSSQKTALTYACEDLKKVTQSFDAK